MPQTLEAPWNGVVLAGSLPGVNVGTFFDASIRNIDRIRILLDPRVIMPPSGSATLGNLTTQVYGSPLDTNQSRNARAIIQACYDNSTILGNVTQRRRAAVLSIACVLGESVLRILANPNVPNSSIPPHDGTSDGTNGTSVGLYQQQVGPPPFAKSASLADVTEVMDPVRGSLLWFDRLTKQTYQTNWYTDNGATEAGNMIQAVQGSGGNANALYTSMMDEAEAIVTEVQFPPLTAAGGGVIPAATQAQLVEIANACQSTTAPVTNVKIEWVLNASTWPTSATASRRPMVSDLVTFWTAMHNVIGTHDATWGFSLLNNPNFAETATANADPDASMTAYANVSWTAGTDPTTPDHQTACRWLEALTTKVVASLRTANFAKNIVVPTMYAPAHLRNIAAFHPSGPWIANTDTAIYYETSFYPASTDQTQIASPYATYASWATTQSAAYRASWSESVYFTFTQNTTTVIDPASLAIPLQDILPADPNAPQITQPLPPTLVSVTPSDGAISATWTAPTYDGGSPIQSYTITAVDAASNTFTSVAPQDLLTATVAGLTNDTAYTVTVLARTQFGFSNPSNSLAVTPTGGLPPVDPPPVIDPGTDPDQPPPEPPIVIPAPTLYAFPPGFLFRPSNWNLSPDQAADAEGLS